MKDIKKGIKNFHSTLSLKWVFFADIYEVHPANVNGPLFLQFFPCGLKDGSVRCRNWQRLELLVPVRASRQVRVGGVPRPIRCPRHFSSGVNVRKFLIFVNDAAAKQASRVFVPGKILKVRLIFANKATS
jgi:hypothetical protein